MRVRAALICGAALGLGGIGWQLARAADLTFVVTSTADAPDATPGDGVCQTGSNNGAVCTLRAAMEEANAQAGSDTINFGIPASDPNRDAATGVFTIRPASPLPTIANGVAINGGSQSGALNNTLPRNSGTNAKILIQIDGSGGGGANGLTIGGSGATNTTGSSTLSGLCINGFSGSGILILAGSNFNAVSNCFLGTDPSGTLARPNGSGVTILGNSNRIGNRDGSSLNRNLLSGNTLDGVQVGTNADGNTVQGNLIGTNAAGTAALGNNDGVRSFGNAGTVAQNVLSGNRRSGALLAVASNGTGSSNQIISNRVGLAATGSATIPNGQDGLFIATRENSISSNTITTQPRDGVRVEGPGADDNIISRNSIFENGGLGINLVKAGDPASGVTPNDPQDADTLQNFPILTSATDDSVTGTLNSLPNSFFQIEIFSNPVNPANSYEGQTFVSLDEEFPSSVGVGVVKTDASGNATFSLTPRSTLPRGQFLTATATYTLVIPGERIPVETSEFSPAIVVTAPRTDTTTSLSSSKNPSGVGENVVFTAPVAPASGASGTPTGSLVIKVDGAVVASREIGAGAGGATLTFNTSTLARGTHIIRAEYAGDAAFNLSASQISQIVSSSGACSTVVTSAAGSGEGSLREAIDCSNILSGTQTISFAIPGNGPHTISPASPLPAVTGTAVIDGTTQPGTSVNTNATGALNSALKIELNGAGAGSNADGLTIAAEGTSVRGLVINRFREGDGIVFVDNAATGGDPASDGSVTGCFIGTDVAGNAALPNGTGIASRGVDDTAIGGTTPAARNLVSGNRFDGVAILGAAQGVEFVNTDGGPIQGNLIGTNAAGTRAVGNGGSGIRLDGNFLGGLNAGPNGALIGGTTAAAGNVVSGNGDSGIALLGQSDSNTVQGNRIGTDVTGQIALGNAGNGILVDESGAITIGGTAAGAGNLISGNGTSPNAAFSGISIGTVRRVISTNTNGLFDVNVQNNTIGTNLDGTAKVPNIGAGVALNGSTTVRVESNLISGNGSSGIAVSGGALNNDIRSNRIGLSAAGAATLGNGAEGILIASNPGAESTGNSLLLNLIAGNGKLGIDLGSTEGGTLGFTGDGVTPNDAGDADGGPNLRFNFPVVSEVTNNTVVGTINAPPNKNIRLEFYASDAADPSGHGEGQRYLGSGGTITDADGNSPIFSFTAPASTSLVGQFISVTATDISIVNRNTSEFSAAVQGVSSGACTATSTVVTRLADSASEGSLRRAIECSNSQPGRQTISFAIPGTGVKKLQLGADLPAITDSVTIDGYTQTDATGNTLEVGTNANLTVELSPAVIFNIISGESSRVGASELGLQVRAPNCLIRGLIIDGFSETALTLSSVQAKGNRIEGCFLGFGPEGVLESFSGGTSLVLDTGANANSIGGATRETRNLISDGFISIRIGGAGTDNNAIQNNLIGVTRTGEAELSNQNYNNNGIQITDAKNTRIGGSEPGLRNVIGVDVNLFNTTGTLIAGNYIGINAQGTTGLGQTRTGIAVINSSDTMVGGTTVGVRNVISNCFFEGIFVSNSTGIASNNRIQGNYIGTNAAGTAAIPNGRGVRLSNTTSDLIGGATTTPGTAPGNLISGNTSEGLSIIKSINNEAPSNGNRVQGNAIGLSATGAPLGNGRDGIAIGFGTTAGNASNQNLIGGSGSGEGNLIAFNGTSATLHGISVVNGTGNRISSNQIYSNGGLGINLTGGAGETAAGVTPNDALDPDNLPNNGQNFPLITSARGNLVTGTLNSYLSEDFRIEIFASDAADPSGSGEGQTFLGAIDNLVTDAQGNLSWNFTSPSNLAGKFISATATYIEAGGGAGAGGAAQDGDTSEFSAAFQAVANPGFSVGDVRLTEGDTGTQDLVFTVTLTPETSSNGRQKAATQAATVNFATANGTATQPGDYLRTSGTLNFAAGETTKTVTVPVVGDKLDEPDETFRLNLSAPSGSVIADGQGIGTIADNDPTPTASINNVRVTEGNSGSKNANFTVSLSNPSTSAQIIDFSTADGTATAGSDYTATAGTLTIAAGKTKGTIAVPVLGDTAVEANETFLVNIFSGTADRRAQAKKDVKSKKPGAIIGAAQGTGTIANDDVAVIPPTFSIGDASIVEGNSGTKNLTFTVTRTVTTGTAASVAFATANGTALSGLDYTATSGTLSFAAGQTSRTLSIPIAGETVREPNETLTVTLSAPSPANAPLARAQGTGTIVNDDFSSDLQITQTVAPAIIPVGGEAIFTLQVRNDGPDAAQNVVVSNLLPSGATFVSASGATFTQSGSTLSFALGTLENGASRTLQITVRAPSVAGSFGNSASVSGTGTPDSNSGNNASTATAQAVLGPQNINGSLQITTGKLVRIGAYVPGLYRKGARFAQRVTIRNTSGNAITGPVVLVLDGLPAGVELVNRSGVTVTPLAGQAFAALNIGGDGVLGAGETSSIQLEFRLRASTRPAFTPRVLSGPGAP